MMRTILVVDDEHDLAAACQRLLSRRGWNVVLASSRDSALAVLARTPRPILAIVDRQLPDGDGVDVLRAAAAFGIPVIVVTGYGTAATRRLALEEGAAGFLAKPFTGDDLHQLVHAIVGEPEGPPVVPPPPRSPSRRLGLHG